MVRDKVQESCSSDPSVWSQADNSLVPPLYLTTVFTYPSSGKLIEFNERKRYDKGLRDADYGRYSNPTEQAVEDVLAELEGAESAILYPSGMAAVTSTLLAITLSFDNPIHIIIGAEGYRKTREFADKDLARLGTSITYIAPDELKQIERYVTPSTKAIFLESPTNPYLRIADLEAIAELGKRRGITTIIDATFASPINQKPLGYGIDLVLHSATKYLGGHNDLLAGVVAGEKTLIALLRERRGISGTIAAPDVAHRLLRSLPELELRVKRQNETGQDVAVFLESSEFVERVWYPGLDSHPEHELATRQLKGFGGVISFEVRGDLDTTAGYLDSLKIPAIGASFGGIQSLIEQPAVISYYHHGEEKRRALGIKDNLIRLSVGITPPELLIQDFIQASSTLMRR